MEVMFFFKNNHRCSTCLRVNPRGSHLNCPFRWATRSQFEPRGRSYAGRARIRNNIHKLWLIMLLVLIPEVSHYLHTHSKCSNLNLQSLLFLNESHVSSARSNILQFSSIFLC